MVLFCGKYAPLDLEPSALLPSAEFLRPGAMGTGANLRISLKYAAKLRVIRGHGVHSGGYQLADSHRSTQSTPYN